MQKEEIIYIPIDSIIKSSCNQRDELNEDHVYKMVDTLKNNRSLPPLLVRKEGDHYGCFDGAHRYSAYKFFGTEQIPVIVKQVSDEEAISLSYTANCGRSWTEAEKAHTCLQLYRSGKDIGAIIEELAQGSDKSWSHDNVKKYIKIAAFLHPDLLNQVKKGGKGGSIPIGLAAKLADALLENQVELYTSFATRTGEKDKLLDNWYRNNPHLRIVHNITELRNTKTGQPKLPRFNAPTKKAKVSMDHSEYIQSLKTSIDEYCKINSCQYLQIVDMLKNG